MNPHLHGLLIYAKDRKNTHEENTASSINGVWKTGQAYAK